MSEEIEKLKALATNKDLYYWQRVEAIEILGNIDSKESSLALLDIANDEGLYYWERDLALSKAREIIKRRVAS